MKMNMNNPQIPNPQNSNFNKEPEMKIDPNETTNEPVEATNEPVEATPETTEPVEATPHEEVIRTVVYKPEDLALLAQLKAEVLEIQERKRAVKLLDSSMNTTKKKLKLEKEKLLTTPITRKSERRGLKDKISTRKSTIATAKEENAKLERQIASWHSRAATIGLVPVREGTHKYSRDSITNEVQSLDALFVLFHHPEGLSEQEIKQELQRIGSCLNMENFRKAIGNMLRDAIVRRVWDFEADRATARGLGDERLYTLNYHFSFVDEETHTIYQFESGRVAEILVEKRLREVRKNNKKLAKKLQKIRAEKNPPTPDDTI
jgi:hypothetical protein